MAKFISLFKYNGAIEGGGPKRFAKVQQIMVDANSEIQQVYGLLGAYDILAILDCPDNRTAMKVAAKAGNLIGASSQTMPAIERDDFLQLLTEI